MDDAQVPSRIRTMPEKPATLSEVTAVLSDDKRRVQVLVKLSNGSTQPDLELILKDAAGAELSRATIMENFGNVLKFTLHIRTVPVTYPLSVRVELSYLENEVFSSQEIQLAQK
ncbi:MAG: hypothetical protein GYA58_07335 [Anaerolineaceae bacterium]|nr:hypothetical protein [Anaerolineaceae bacterium]